MEENCLEKNKEIVEAERLDELKTDFNKCISASVRKGDRHAWFWCECHPNIFDNFMTYVTNFGYPAKIIEADTVWNKYRIEVSLVSEDAPDPDPTKYGFSQKEFEERQKDLA